ncbi:hypothetical protein FDI69_gp239 [Rhodococcus phage Trina]|uniref:Uncharacterized protein n=1 Tax=Rhodococcus phage Trina TaxID=2027905 RepID=A0A2D0ZNK0_9CAUD|nr:hypothetical protein FDI69_gp239 [Rhodococcus phage Trina]ASZ74948.1 hypothetical protein SEA_TRINA_147 [Rhodococcus phage Trina]
MLDLDCEHLYIKSTTEGHGHLMFNIDLEQKDMLEVLEVLSRHGVIQHGFYQATKDRGFASLRMPGQTKGSVDDRWFYDEFNF